MINLSDLRTTECEVCKKGFDNGDIANYHIRLDVWVHGDCIKNNLVRGEDISQHAMLGRRL